MCGFYLNFAEYFIEHFQATLIVQFDKLIVILFSNEMFHCTSIDFCRHDVTRRISGFQFHVNAVRELSESGSNSIVLAEDSYFLFRQRSCKSHYAQTFYCCSDRSFENFIDANFSDMHSPSVFHRLKPPFITHYVLNLTSIDGVRVSCYTVRLHTLLCTFLGEPFLFSYSPFLFDKRSFHFLFYLWFQFEAYQLLCFQHFTGNLCREILANDIVYYLQSFGNRHFAHLVVCEFAQFFGFKVIPQVNLCQVRLYGKGFLLGIDENTVRREYFLPFFVIEVRVCVCNYFLLIRSPSPFGLGAASSGSIFFSTERLRRTSSDAFFSCEPL